MKFLMRLIGTWLVGLALVLLVIDGTKTLAESRFVISPISELWAAVDLTNWLATVEWIGTNLSPFGFNILVETVLGWPGSAVSFVLGLLCLFIGRKPVQARYMEPQ